MKDRWMGGRPVPLLALALSTVVVLSGPALAEDPPPVYWSAQLRSTGYFLQQAGPGATEVEDRLPFYEQVDASIGNLLDGKLDFRFSGRYADDARFDGGVPQEGKWFAGYARAQFDPLRTQVRVGRQFIQEGAIFATLDGGWVSLRPHPQWKVNGWVGSTAPWDRAFEFGDDLRYGGRVNWAAMRELSLGAWAAQWTEDGTTLASQFGGEAVIRPLRTLKVLARGTFEAERSELERVDVLVDWKHRRDWPVFRGQYQRRSQRYRIGSWWEQFGEDLHAVQLLRGSVAWTDERGIGGEIQGFGSYVDDHKNGEIGAAFLAPHLRLGAGYLSGDGGEQWRIYGDLNWSVAHRLDLRAGATFAEYALVADPTDDQTRDLATYYARGDYMIAPGIEFMSELQVLDNPVYSSDVRLLVGLDLMAGRGASRVGIGSGGGHR